MVLHALLRLLPRYPILNAQRCYPYGVQSLYFRTGVTIIMARCDRRSCWTARGLKRSGSRMVWEARQVAARAVLPSAQVLQLMYELLLVLCQQEPLPLVRRRGRWRTRQGRESCFARCASAGLAGMRAFRHPSSLGWHHGRWRLWQRCKVLRPHDRVLGRHCL